MGIVWRDMMSDTRHAPWRGGRPAWSGGGRRRPPVLGRGQPYRGVLFGGMLYHRTATLPYHVQHALDDKLHTGAAEVHDFGGDHLPRRWVTVGAGGPRGVQDGHEDRVWHTKGSSVTGEAGEVTPTVTGGEWSYGRRQRGRAHR